MIAENTEIFSVINNFLPTCDGALVFISYSKTPAGSWKIFASVSGVSDNELSNYVSLLLIAAKELDQKTLDPTKEYLCVWDSGQYSEFIL